MVGIWTLLLSVIAFAIGGAAAVVCFRSGHRIAVVLGLDAAIIAALGILLNATSSGELRWVDVLIFVALPVVLAAAATILAFRGRQNDPRYEPAATTRP